MNSERILSMTLERIYTFDVYITFINDNYYTYGIPVDHVLDFLSFFPMYQGFTKDAFCEQKFDYIINNLYDLNALIDLLQYASSGGVNLVLDLKVTAIYYNDVPELFIKNLSKLIRDKLLYLESYDDSRPLIFTLVGVYGN